MPSVPETHPSTARLVELLDGIPAERIQPIYDRHGVENGRGAEALAREISLDGASTVMSVLRRWKGVPYAVIVRDVARKMNVRAGNDEPVPAIELRLLEELVRSYLQKANAEEREQVQKYLQKAGNDHQTQLGEMVSGAMAVGTLALIMEKIGRHAVAEVVRWIVLRTATRRAATEAARRASSIAGWAVPFLNVALVGWTVADIAGPAFRKTVPTVLEVALLRLEYASEDFEG